ncbi:MAG: alpha/beta hydrolase [Desulfobacteraceae bacterium]|nr:MAG: alpha/beta hydrolase [Desulfobacteraceae bacterium]
MRGMKSIFPEDACEGRERQRRRFRQIRRTLFENAFRLLARIHDFSKAQQAAAVRCEKIADIPYLTDGNPDHLLDIYRPKHAAHPLPVMLYIHGGGFVMCDKDTHRGIGLIYADHGHVVFNVNYRLAPRHPYPAALADVGRAYAWVVENAARYGGDPGRIIIAGESAGGNLTLAMAAACCFRMDAPEALPIWDVGVVPKIIMVMCGFLQVSDPHRFSRVCPPINPFSRSLGLQIARDVSRAYLGRTYRRPHPDRILADPLLVLESNITEARPFPSVYAMSGNSDIIVDDTRRLEGALKKRGIRHAARYFPRQGHAFHLLGISRQADLFWQDNLDFLGRWGSRWGSNLDL